MNVEVLTKAYAAKIDGAKALAAAYEGKEDSMPKEVITQIDVLLKEAEEIKGKIEMGQRIQAGDVWLNQSAGTKGAHLAPGVSVTMDEGDQKFASAGEFFMAVKNAALYPGAEDVRLRSRKNKESKATGLSEGVPADGGYLLAPQVSSKILDRMYSTGEILSRIPIDPITGNSNAMDYNGIDESSRVAGSRWGGVLGYWVAEGGTITKSKPAFRQIELKLKDVAALCYATNDQLQDTANLESWLMRVCPEELRFQVEDAIYEGDGVGKPLGIMNSPCLVSALRVDASKVQLADINTLWARRWGGVKDYVWFINQDVTPQLDAMTAATAPVYLPPGGLSAAPYGTLKGRPVIEVEYAATMGTTGDIMLASMSQYQAIDRGGVQSASSIHVQFVTNETAFRFVYRFHGAPTWGSALTPFKGSNTQSPFVVLTSAST
ncbi:hypothetical protein CCP3SC1AL1_770010 [Gammaproteobacteria bacterium]